MKKIEVREYEPGEYLVITYKLINEVGTKDWNEKPLWKKISVYDPRVMYEKKVAWGKGKDCDLLARIIISTFDNLIEGKSKEEVINSIKRVNTHLENIILNYNNLIILEEDVVRII